MNPENHYLYFQIRDQNQNVRANIIGSQHWVDRKDKSLNPTIIAAIQRSSKAILEQPPGSKMLPPHELATDTAITNITQELNDKNASSSHRLRPVKSLFIQKEIDSVLKRIQEKVIPEDLNKVQHALIHIDSDKDQLIFLNLIEEDLWAFNLASLEHNINNVIIQANIPYEDLEEGIDLYDLIEKAKEKIRERELSQTEIIESDEPISEEIDDKALQADLYDAWVRGDAKALRTLLDKSHNVHKEPPEISQIHDNRADNMAQKITKIVLKAKDDNTEAVVVVGDAHLLYTKRKNIIEFLKESFATNPDLRGWSITQIDKEGQPL